MEMKNLIYGAVLSGLVCTLVSCDEDTDPVNFAPRLEAAAASNVTRTSATISGSIDNFNRSSLEDFGFMYSTVASLPEDATVKVSMTDMGSGTLVADISGLTAGTTYYWCTYANSGASVAKSAIKSFTSESTTCPTLGTFEDSKQLKVLSVGENSCKVRALLLDDGGKESVTVGFMYYKKSASEETAVNVSTSLNSDGTFETEIKELEDGCEYCIYPYALNGNAQTDITKGQPVFVTTVKYEMPVLSIDKLLEKVSDGYVRATAFIYKGSRDIIEQGFCYSCETDVPTKEEYNSVKADMEVEGRISAEIPVKEDDMTYAVRAYAIDDKGNISYSETVSFKLSDFYDLRK